MSERTPPILSALEKNKTEGRVPFHMPGHKRNTDRFAYLRPLGGDVDITEIDGFDNLHGAEGILREAMERAAALWHSERTYFLVNGSSCGILAGIRTLTRRGDTVLLSRGAHKSVYHALELCGLRPVFLTPPTDARCGISCSLLPETVEAALCAHPEARLVIVTSPSYEGVLSDIAAIAETVHAHGAALLVDEAHGAHLSLHPAFPRGAVSCGADIVVQSVHKTLPSLTQTAILHAQGGRVDLDRLAHQLAVFETSSPSYLFLASIDGCVRTLAEDRAVMADWAERLAAFDARVGATERLFLPYHGTHGATIPGVFSFDPSKIYVSTAETDWSGETLAAFLREWHIEPEMTTPEGVLLMSGAGDTMSALEHLADVLREADARCNAAESRVRKTDLPVFGELAVSLEEAMEQAWEYVPPAAAVGRIAAEYIWAYPPGIPLVIPGERIAVNIFEESGRTYHATHGGAPEKIAVLRES